MTVPAGVKIVSGPYVGNGMLDTYDYDFLVTAAEYIEVYETTSAGTQTKLTLYTDFTVTGIGNETGGTVTRVAGNLPTDFTWYIRSNYVLEQETDFASQGAFYPQVHERSFDNLVYLIKQQQDLIDRSFKLDPGYSGPALGGIQLPAAAPGKYLRWNADGTALENGDIDVILDNLQTQNAEIQDLLSQTIQAVTINSTTIESTTTIIAGEQVQAKYFLGEVIEAEITEGVLTIDASLGTLYVVEVDQDITAVNFTNFPAPGGTVGGVFGVIFNNLGEYDFEGSVNATGWTFTRVENTDLSLKPNGLTNMVLTTYPGLGVILINKNTWDWESA